MIRLSNSELRALFVQYQQHKDCEYVEIHRGMLGRLQFHFEEPQNKEALKKIKILEAELSAEKKKAKVHN